MSDIKHELKQAREAIKKKQHKDALKHCKNVLKLEKDNYNALVFVGVCATELEQYEQAKQAYEKAIEKNQDQILAWQGVSSLYEKANNPNWSSQHIEVYSKLLTGHISDDKKWLDTCNKIVLLLKQEKNYTQASHWIKKSISKLSNQEDIVFAWKDVITLLQNDDNKDDCKIQLLDAYRRVVEVADSISFDVEDECMKYLHFVLKHAKCEGFPSLSETFKLAETFHESYENNSVILSLLCTLVLHQNVGLNSIDAKSIAYLKKLASLEEDPSTTLLMNGVLKYLQRNEPDALSSFKKAATIKNEDPILFLYITKCHNQLHHGEASIQQIVKCRAVLDNVLFKETTLSIEKQLNFIEIKSLLEQEHNEKNKNAIQNALEKLVQPGVFDASVRLLQATVNFRFGLIEEADENILMIEDSMDVDNELKQDLLHLKAVMSIKEGKYFDAELRLQESLDVSEDNSKGHFLLGTVYWLLGETDQEYYAKAYLQFLKAAKLDPYHSSIFVYLGRYQKDFIKDKNKALKCFEKAFTLDVSNQEAGSFLGDLYLQLGFEDKAVETYEAVTLQAHIGESVWAWVRFGLIHLKQRNADKAVICFQHALRGGNTDVSHYWECLAEAYFMKGSYISALKSFTKALQLDSTSIYCQYKIAKVKQMLSLDAEAMTEYEQLLSIDPYYVPALLGSA